ncbi:MAG: NADH-ubiquinone oxidoreductase-F iron-sulfur binding region domain-containing protein [Saccharofermentanales bacterium]|jgi:ferredoxin
MNKPIIVNAIEADAAVPVKLLAIQQAPQQFLKWLHSFEGTSYTAVVSKGSELVGLLHSLGLEILETAISCGLVCQEPSAILQLLAGEKPYPYIRSQTFTGPQEELIVVNVLSYANCDNLLSYIQLKDDKSCAMQRLMGLVDRLLTESCGKCVFCREGLGQIHSILYGVSEGEGEANDLSVLQDLLVLLKEQVICNFGPIAAKAISQILTENCEEMLEHFQSGICRQTICHGLSYYRILGSKCTGCGDCVDACAEDAILGKPDFIHVIQDRDCTRCGKCLEVCTKSAIVRCSANKPVCPVRPVRVGSWNK